MSVILMVLCSIVTQDPFIWHEFIRENLDVTSAHTDSEIWDVLAALEMHEVVSDLVRPGRLVYRHSILIQKRV